MDAKTRWKPDEKWEIGLKVALYKLVTNYKGVSSDFVVEKSGRNHFNQVITTWNGTLSCHVPPDIRQWKQHKIKSVAWLTEVLNPNWFIRKHQTHVEKYSIK